MKVLQALFFPPEQPGGVSSMVPHLMTRFNEDGWQMELFSLPKRIRRKGTQDYPFTTFRAEDYAGHPVVDKYLQTLRDYMWWVKLRMQGREHDFDVIHAHHPVAALAMHYYFPHIPVVTTIHSSYETELILSGKIREGGLAHHFLTHLYREVEQASQCLTVASQSFQEYIGRYVEQGDALRLIRNGISQKRFKPHEHHNETMQLLTLCRLVPAKGIDVLLEACALLKKRGLPFVLHVIGDGPIRDKLEQMAKDLQIYDEVIFYGYLLHPDDFMPFFDIFVLPSRAEAFGSVFAEAALCQMPLVGTEVGGIAEQIEPGVNGLLVPQDNPAALADALAKLMLDEPFRLAMGAGAREKARREYSLTRMIEALREVYKSIR
jgi:glycosyltransferase involved in cell wall biosynthesis